MIRVPNDIIVTLPDVVPAEIYDAACMEAVQSTPSMIMSVRKPCVAVQVYVVGVGADYIQYIKDPCVEAQMVVAKTSAYELFRCVDPVCTEAIEWVCENNPEGLPHELELTPEQQAKVLLYYKNNPDSTTYIKEPCTDLPLSVLECAE